jgi:hypothetical protein
MNAFTLLVSIAQSIAVALSQNPGNPAKVIEWTGYLNLATALATRFAAGDTDLQVLDDQLKQAVIEGRGLTPEERSAWRARDDLATEVARVWLAEHPKAGGR